MTWTGFSILEIDWRTQNWMASDLSNGCVFFKFHVPSLKKLLVNYWLITINGNKDVCIIGKMKKCDRLILLCLII